MEDDVTILRISKAAYERGFDEGKLAIVTALYDEVQKEGCSKEEMALLLKHLVEYGQHEINRKYKQG